MMLLSLPCVSLQCPFPQKTYLQAAVTYAQRSRCIDGKSIYLNSDLFEKSMQEKIDEEDPQSFKLDIKPYSSELFFSHLCYGVIILCYRFVLVVFAVSHKLATCLA